VAATCRAIGCGRASASFVKALTTAASYWSDQRAMRREARNRTIASGTLRRSGGRKNLRSIP
jgi:hypothetical protein